MLSSLPPARRRIVLGAAAAAVVAALAIVWFTVVQKDDGAPALPQGAPGPVLLVPGYGGSTTSLSQLAGVLQQRGRTASVVTLPGNGEGDLDEQARTLDTAVRAALANSTARTVDVVGYSAGGVVARLWVERHGGDRLARRVLTLGSPHHGTRVADVAGTLAPGACPEACQQLRTDSDVLDDLNDDDETPSGPTWVSIWTTSDDVVTPPDSAHLDGALNLTVQSVCTSSGVGHGQLPTDPGVQAMVVAELAAGPPVQLGPSDCGRS